MTVAQLIADLQNFPPTHIVVMSKDGEGNSFSPFAEANIGMYEADSTWSGDLVCEEDADDYKENAVVLWPTN